MVLLEHDLQRKFRVTTEVKETTLMLEGVCIPALILKEPSVYFFYACIILHDKESGVGLPFLDIVLLILQ